jgi:predicted MFS family arabinose efflux permease
MTVPVFCLALPAGVWADRFNRRNWLLASQLLLLTIAALMAALTYLGWVTPTLLLILTAAMGMAMVLNQPAWQALTPELVPAAMVPSAVAVGSVSFNLARSIGPAAAGLLIANIGVWATFSVNAMSFVGVIVVLLMWKPSVEDTSHRASPEFMNELRKGMFVVSNSLHLRNALYRVLIFAISASILWSLLPLVATEKLGYQERGFGICLTLIGAGAVMGAWFLPLLRSRYSSELLILVAELLFAAICLTIAITNSPLIILPALLVVGVCWMSIMTTLNATAQVNLPRKFRARGMAAYLMFFALGMAIGSATWGWLAYGSSLEVAFAVSSITMTLTGLSVHRLKIGSLQVSTT